MAEIRKILVVRLSSIGDIILTTALLRSLKTRYPEARITFVIKKQYAELLSASPYIDELITFDKAGGFRALKTIKDYLRKNKFDVYLDIHNNLRSYYLRLGLGAKRIASYNKQLIKRTLLIWFRINRYTTIKPVYLRYFESALELGVGYDGLGTEIHYPPVNDERVKVLLGQVGFFFESPLVVLCPSATYTNKRWKPQGFIETARRLILEKSAFVVVHGGQADVELCGMIASRIGSRAVSLAGQLTLSESAALLKLSTLVIANDSGLLHLAQSQKKPVVGIYGPTTRELGYFPVEQNSMVVEKALSCRPCTHNGRNYCPKRHFRCMNDIPASSVIDAALSYLT